jgi:hypothetical protein
MRIVSDVDSYLSERRQWEQLVCHERLPRQVFRPAAYRFYFVDFDAVFSARFLSGLLQTCRFLGCDRLSLAVLEPDPQHYFFAHFQRFPLLVMDAKDDAAACAAVLLKDPGQSPADAMAINSEIIVIYPENQQFAVYGERELELAIIATFVPDAARAIEQSVPPSLLWSPPEGIEALLRPRYRGAVPERLRAELLRNYTQRETAQ